MPRYYARRRRRPQSSRSVGACRRPDAPYGRTPRSLKVLGQHLEGGQPNSSVRRRRTSRRDVVLMCRDASRRVLNRVGCCCLLSHSHAFTDDRRAPDRLTCPPQAHPRPPRRSSASPLVRLAARPPRRSSASPLALVLHAIRSADGFPQQDTSIHWDDPCRASLPSDQRIRSSREKVAIGPTLARGKCSS